MFLESNAALTKLPNESAFALPPVTIEGKLGILFLTTLLTLSITGIALESDFALSLTFEASDVGVAVVSATPFVVVFSVALGAV